jgi:Rrf2 family protein
MARRAKLTVWADPARIGRSGPNRLFALDIHSTGLKVDVKILISFFREGFLMISLTAEYALRAVVTPGSTPECPRTKQIAEQTRVSSDYLAKVLRALSRAGLVVSQRGLYGGFVLSRPLDELTILDVINAVDPLKRIDRCPLGLDGHGDHLCPLHQRLDQGIAQLEALFGAITIGQLLAEQKSNYPLCSGTAHGISPDRSRGECHTLGKSSPRSVAPHSARRTKDDS